MTDRPPKDPAENCNARRTDGSGYCGQPAGWGTDHNGHGRCKFHGGNTTNQEKGLIDDLEDAAADAAVAYRLKMKHVKRKAEAGEHEDIDWAELDRLARTAFDRTGTGPTDKHEHEDVTEGEGGFGTDIIVSGEYDPADGN